MNLSTIGLKLFLTASAAIIAIAFASNLIDTDEFDRVVKKVVIVGSVVAFAGFLMLIWGWGL